VHAVVRKSGTTVDEITSGLKSAGLVVDSAAPVIPSLEDVFLDVVDRMERGGES
jgi:hypothetical protein